MKPLRNLMHEKKKKLDALKKKGMEPYAYSFDVKHFSADIKKKFPSFEGKVVSLAGRIMSMRTMGKITFGDLQDREGTIQFSVRADEVGDFYRDFVELFERGDIIGVNGKVYKTKKGEITVGAKKIEMLAKSLRPLPDKWHGLKDVEERYRQRYVDLVMNKEAKEVFFARARLVSGMREFLDKQGFLEVETPVLQPIYGGAMAKPFETWHNELKRKMFLRISDELFLKKLIVGGMDRVYEIGKDFRNESIDTLHNPEFTQLEFYGAYLDYKDMMKLTEELLRHSIKKAVGKTSFEYRGNTIDVKKKFKVVSLVGSVSKYLGKDVLKMSDKEILEIGKKEGSESRVPGKIIEDIFSEKIQPKLIQPTFLIDFPVDISPLAKRKRGNEQVVERFEIYIGGEECGNAFSELNNPIEQYDRFSEQEGFRRSKRDVEAQPMDKDYVRALEYGMPPTGGVGVGIDRLVMVITNNPNLRETILFPALRKTEKFEVFGDFGHSEKS
jgi:lysyl-tRNA synthetase class 2